MTTIKASYDERFLQQLIGTNMVSNVRVAITELIANAWDAGATRVDIQWPENSSQNEFYIRDNGIGLSQEQFQNRFMRISYNRINEQGKSVTFPEGVEVGKRMAFGKNGIGRLAAFCFADQYFVESTSNGKDQIAYKLKRGTEISLLADPIEPKFDFKTSGTAIYTKEFKGRSIELMDLRKEIGMRFLSDPNFQIFVNKEKIDLVDIPGINVHRFNVDLEGLESIEIIGIDTSRPDGSTKQHGVAWHVNGRLVGRCSWKGPNNEKFLDGRKSLAKRFTFIVRADCLADMVKPDWEGFQNDGDLYPRVLEAVNQAILKFISEFFSEARTETFNEIKSNHEPILKKLSPTEIEEWEGFVRTTQEECINLPDDVLNDLAKILANLLQAKSRYALLHKLGNYNPNQLDDLNDILSKWTVDMAKEVLDELELRMLLVKELEAKVKRTDTDELRDLQPLFERGLWIFGPEYESIHFTSNKGMTRVLKEIFGIEEKGSRDRPDFVILPDSSIGAYSIPKFSDQDGGEIGVDRLVILELKRPGISIGSEQQQQTMKYIKELRQKGAIDDLTKVTGFPLGSEIDPFETEPLRQGNITIQPLSYDLVIRRAESRLLNLKARVESAPFLQKIIETNRKTKAQAELEGI